VTPFTRWKGFSPSSPKYLPPSAPRWITLGVTVVTLRELFDRYGPTAAVLAILSLLIVLLPGNAEPDTGIGVGATGTLDSGGFTSPDAAATGTDATGVAGGDTAGGAVATGGRAAGGATGAATGGATPARGAQAAGTQAVAAPPGGVVFGTGAKCRSDKRQLGISYAMPPCVDWKPGANNGGATARGVTADKIILSRFRGISDPATEAALIAAGANDTEETTNRVIEALRRYYNHHYETYGREVVIVEVQASGESDNDEAMRADAVRIADEVKAFANVGGPTVLAQELAARGVPCMCTTSLSQQFYLENPPMIFSDLPTGEEYFSHTAEYVQKRLWGKPAKWAGDPAMVPQTRKIGLVYFEGSGKANPYYQLAHQHFLKEVAERKLSLVADVGYVMETSEAPDIAASVIAKLRSSGASTVIFSGDPLFPIFLTKEATRQQYFPEWVMMGTALTDTTFFGRTYDPAQWAHAFGISPLPVFWEREEGSPGYREVHHGMQMAHGDEGVALNVTRSPYNLFFRGVHMAGPNLTPDTFVQGMFAYPPTGGSPANPMLRYTRESPTSYEDFTEVWWDPQRASVDETGKTAAGSLMKSNQGTRYTLGKWPAGTATVFGDDPNPIYTSDNPPGGRDPQHEQDGHSHPYDKQGCGSCAPKS
jgi:hypothetical protein